MQSQKSFYVSQARLRCQRQLKISRLKRFLGSSCIVAALRQVVTNSSRETVEKVSRRGDKICKDLEYE